MNRPIKFRAWHLESKEHRGFMVYEDNEAIFGYNFIEGHPIMQFTGLHDKNGKEIFQSDLIKDDEGWLWEVATGYDGFYLLSKEKDIRPDRKIHDRVKFITVVGNIYEN